MKRELLPRVLFVCGACLLTILVLEASIRALGETDSDGQFRLLGRELPPYVLPLGRLRAKIDEYLVNRERATMIPDPATGWTYRPNSLREDGGFTINGAGIRSLREHTLAPAKDTLRIALFGDSFVAGDEVKDGEEWGFQLERLLTEAGARAEVLNFGVSGYSMGQAFLRWRHEGKRYKPDLVIFVFQVENLDRNVNLFRSLYPQGGVVYSKPRFILANGGLTLINSPALPPEALMKVFEDFPNHPLAAHEAYYRGRDQLSLLPRASMLAGLAHVVLNRFTQAASTAQLYGPASERGALGKAIVDAFAADVAASSAKFILLHLPRKDHFRAFHAGEAAPYRHLLDHFQAAYHFISAEDFLGVEYTEAAYYQPGGHYGPEIHLRIAEALAADLVACSAEKTCRFARFPDAGFLRR